MRERMTNKQIIINGTDVSKCKNFSDLQCSCDYEEWNGEIMSFKFCHEKPSCYFKQLARAKDKIDYMEEYIKTVETARNNLEREVEKWKHQAELGSDTTNRLSDQLQAKEQECEKLKWYLKEIRNEELLSLDIDYDEYETHCIDTEYTNIINLVEEALGE